MLKHTVEGTRWDMAQRRTAARGWSTALVTVLVGTVTACSSPTGAPEPIPPAPAPAVSSSPAVVETDVADTGAQKIAITGDWLSAGEQGVWLSGEEAIYRLDPTTGATVATIKVPEGPCEASAVGLGAVWTATCSKSGLARIDPKTNKVTDHLQLEIPLSMGGEASIGVGDGSVWLVLNGSDCIGCRVAQIDPKKMRVVKQIPVSPGSAGVRYGENAVWVTNPDENTVTKIDPRTRKVVRTSEVGAHPRFFAVGEGAVWTLDQAEGHVSRLDPGTGQTTTIDLGFAGEGGDLTTGGGWVWARGAVQLLARIDPRTNQVAETYGPASGSGAVIVGYDAVWFSAHDIGTVWRMPLPTS